jgi:hypothetical protein
MKTNITKYTAPSIALFVAMLFASCTKIIPFQKQVYRGVDDKQVITLVSADELELNEGGTNLICKYSKEGDKLRVVLNVMGTTQAVYYQITPQGLRGSDGTVLYEPSQYQTVMNQINAQRRQAHLNSMLSEAAKRGDVRSINDVLTQGAQIDAGNNRGATALMVAIEAGHADAVDAILEHHANPNLVGQEGTTPLMVAANTGGQQGFVNMGRNPEQDRIVRMLIEHGASLNAQEVHGYTALMLSLSRRNLDTTKLIVRAGADRRIRNREGKTAFDYAAQEEEKAALRTDEEEKLFVASRTPTRTIARYREVAPLYGFRGNELRGGETVITDVNLAGPASNMDSDVNVWFGNVHGQIEKADGQRQAGFFAKPEPEYYVVIPNSRNLMFLDPNVRNECYKTLIQAITEWRSKFGSVAASN